MKNSNLIDRQMFGNKSNFFLKKKSLTLSPQANKPSGHPSLSPDQNYDLRTSKLLFRMFIIFHAFCYNYLYHFNGPKFGLVLKPDLGHSKQF